VSLIGGGEPTASPHILTVLTALHTRGIRAGVVTNGSRLTPALQTCLANACAWVRVSLDAATEATYQAIHRPSDGTSLCQVVNDLAGLSRRMPGRVGASFLITARNGREIADAARLAKHSGCAYIRFRPAQHPTAGRYPSLHNAPEIVRQLAEARTLADGRFQVSESECLDLLAQGRDAIAEQNKT
jgi:wyosine [tRNA(Phe)-imidazoG37] synthetase (radical SAM superfamily)